MLPPTPLAARPGWQVTEEKANDKGAMRLKFDGGWVSCAFFLALCWRATGGGTKGHGSCQWQCLTRAHAARLQVSDKTGAGVTCFENKRRAGVTSRAEAEAPAVVAEAAAAAEPAAAATMPTDVRRGYLTKKSGIRPTWSRRWFVLDGRRLGYYEAEDDIRGPNFKPAKGVIDLTVVAQARASSAPDAAAEEIELVLEARTYRLRAGMVCERDEWIAALAEAAAVPGSMLHAIEGRDAAGFKALLAAHSWTAGSAEREVGALVYAACGAGQSWALRLLHEDEQTRAHLEHALLREQDEGECTPAMHAAYAGGLATRGWHAADPHTDCLVAIGELVGCAPLNRWGDMPPLVGEVTTANDGKTMEWVHMRDMMPGHDRIELLVKFDVSVTKIDAGNRTALCTYVHWWRGSA